MRPDKTTRRIDKRIEKLQCFELRYGTSTAPLQSVNRLQPEMVHPQQRAGDSDNTKARHPFE